MARGRAPNLSLPPTRQLANQRDYRARKAAHISGLESKVVTLEQRVADLEEELRQMRAGKSGGLSHKEASELRQALLQSLTLVNAAYPSTQTDVSPVPPTPVSLTSQPRASFSTSSASQSPSYISPLNHASASPPAPQQQTYTSSSQAGPSTYFAHPPPQPQQQQPPPQPQPYHHQHPQGFSPYGNGVSPRLHQQQQQQQQQHQQQEYQRRESYISSAPVVPKRQEEAECCEGIFDCGPFPAPSSAPIFPQTQPVQLQLQAMLPQPQPQLPLPASSCGPGLKCSPQQPLQHPLLLLAQTSTEVAPAAVCCDVETAMRDGCQPTADGGWARIVGVPRSS